MPTQRRIFSEATNSPTMIKMMPRMITEFLSKQPFLRAWTAPRAGAIRKPAVPRRRLGVG